MENDKFFNYYIENLTNSLNEAIGKTIVFQTQQRVLSEENSTLKQNLEVAISENSTLRNELEGMNSNFTVIENLKIENQNLRESSSHMETFKNELISSRKELEDLKTENQTLRENTSHMETFKSELISCRKELEDTKAELEKLKVDKEKVNIKTQKIETKSDSKIKTDLPKPKTNFVKDGGSF